MRLEELNLAIGPLLAAQGVRRWKGYRLECDRPSGGVASMTRDPGAATAALAAHGIVIRDEPTGG